MIPSSAFSPSPARLRLRSAAWLSALIAVTLAIAPAQAAPRIADAPLSAPSDSTEAQVAILGMFHFVSESNAFRQDFGKDEVMTPQRQQELETLVDRLADFNPTKIAVERPYYTLDTLNSKYRAYRRGDYTLTAEETDQIAFRLGKALGHDSLHLVQSGNPAFDMAPVQQYAREHGQTQWMDSARTAAKSMLTRLDSVLQAGTVIDGLRYFNTETIIERNYRLYTYISRIGERGERVGANLMASWQAQNLRIFENIRAVAEPGDRVLVIYGAAHKRELRRYIREAPRLEYVEITRFL